MSRISLRARRLAFAGPDQRVARGDRPEQVQDRDARRRRWPRGARRTPARRRRSAASCRSRGPPSASARAPASRPGARKCAPATRARAAPTPCRASARATNARPIQAIDAELVGAQRRAGQHEQHDEEQLARRRRSATSIEPVLAVEVARADAEHEQREQHRQPADLRDADGERRSMPTARMNCGAGRPCRATARSASSRRNATKPSRNEPATSHSARAIGIPRRAGRARLDERQQQRDARGSRRCC